MKESFILLMTVLSLNALAEETLFADSDFLEEDLSSESFFVPETEEEVKVDSSKAKVIEKKSITKSEKQDIESSIKLKSTVSDTSYIGDLDTGVELASQSYDKDGQEADGQTIRISVGKTFDLGHSFTTQTSVSLAYGNANIQVHNDLDYATGSVMDLGLAQRLYHNTSISFGTIRPFIGLGLGKGQFKNTTLFKDSNAKRDLTLEYDAKLDYTRLTGELGAELALSNGLVPFISVAFNSYSTAERWKTDDKVSFNGEEMDLGRDLASADAIESISSSAITIGLGYAF